MFPHTRISYFCIFPLTSVGNADRLTQFVAKFVKQTCQYLHYAHTLPLTGGRWKSWGSNTCTHMYPLSGLTIERALTKSIKPRDKQNDNKGRKRTGTRQRRRRREGKAVWGMRIAMGQWQRRFTYSRHSGEDVVVHRGPLKLTSSALPKAHACVNNSNNNKRDRDRDRDRVLPTWDKKDD